MISTLLQNAFVAALLLWAAAYIARRIWLTVSGNGGGCGSHCKGCSSSESSGPPGAFVPLELLESDRHKAKAPD